MPLGMSSIRKNNKRVVISNAANALLHVMQARNADCSNHVVVHFLGRVRHALLESALHDERKIQVQQRTFILDVLDDQTCLRRFRFKKADIYKITDDWNWAIEQYRTKRRRYATSPVLSFCILARRLGTVSRWSDLEMEFGMFAPALNEIFYEALEFMFENYGHLVTAFNTEFIQLNAGRYAAAIESAGAPLNNCVGFIDVTNLYIARPKGTMQRATYNGHKRRNCLKMQAISLPDGLIYHLFGPVDGRRHDITVLRRSNLEEHVQQSLLVDEKQYCLYGDPAYVLREYMQVGFSGAHLTPQQRAFNKDMSKVRIAVEWGFKDIKKYFTHVDFPRKLSLPITPAALWYYVAAILWNFRACLYSSQTSQYFQCKPCSFDEYLNTR